MDRFFQVLIAALFVVVSRIGVAAEPPPLLFVFDLDDTLIRYHRPPERTEGYFLPRTGDFRGYRYRVLDGAPELIASVLKIPGARVAFYSAGDRERNERILGELELPDGRTAKEVATAILSKEDLVNVNGAEKKDLRKLITPEIPLERVVLIDDVPSWAHPGQEKNVLFVGKRPKFYETDLSDGPMSTEEFLQDRNKLARVRGVIERVMNLAEKGGLSVTEALWRFQWRPASGAEPEYRKELLGDLDLYRRGAKAFHAVNRKYRFVSAVPGKPGVQRICSLLFYLLNSRPAQE